MPGLQLLSVVSRFCGYAGLMSGVVEEAVTERFFRESAVSRTKAVIAAIVVGAAAAVATYRALRSRP